MVPRTYTSRFNRRPLSAPFPNDEILMTNAKRIPKSECRKGRSRRGRAGLDFARPDFIRHSGLGRLSSISRIFRCALGKASLRNWDNEHQRPFSSVRGVPLAN
jgi:hypothetical protein